MAKVKTVNEELMDRAVRHATYTERLKTAEVNTVIALLNREMFPEIFTRVETTLRELSNRAAPINIKTNKRLSELRSNIKKLVSAGTSSAYVTLRDDLINIGQAESHHQANTITAAIPLGINFDASPANPLAIKSIVSSKPFEGALLKNWFDKLSVDAQFEIVKQINTGLAKAETVTKIIRRIKVQPVMHSGTAQRVKFAVILKPSRARQSIIQVRKPAK